MPNTGVSSFPRTARFLRKQTRHDNRRHSELPITDLGIVCRRPLNGDALHCNEVTASAPQAGSCIAGCNS